jgi:predicted component of type VI protein secretion system
MRRITTRRHAFKPSVSDATLEDRVVLNGSGITYSRLFPVTNGGVPAQAYLSSAFAGGNAIPASQSGVVSVQRANVSMVRQLETAYLRQVRTTSMALRQSVRNQLSTLFANGSPTAQQLADFHAFVTGALNAATLQLSSQAALLPGSSSRLVPAIQSSLLGTARTSLNSRIQSILTSTRTTASSQGLQNALSQQINLALANQGLRLSSFFNTTPLNRLSVSPSGQSIPLQQFVGNQIVSQLSNNLSALSQAFPTVANSSLFANGVTTPTTAAQTAFLNQANQALGTAAFQLGSDLALFPNTLTSLLPQLQSSFFAPGVGLNSLTGALQGLPFTSTGFNTAATSAFTTGLQNLASPLNNFFGITPLQPLMLSDGEVVSLLGGNFLNMGNGFNNGFGSGFIGFGSAPTTANTNFGTGFFGLVGSQLPALGFTTPTTLGSNGVVGSQIGNGTTGNGTLGGGTLMG